MTMLEKLRWKSSVPDLTQEVAELALEEAEQTIKNYCHLEYIPSELEQTKLNIAADICRIRYCTSQRISGGIVKSITAGDTSYTIDVPEEQNQRMNDILTQYQTELNAYRKLRW